MDVLEIATKHPLEQYCHCSSTDSAPKQLLMLYETNRVCVLLLPLQLFPKLANMLDMDKLANSSHIDIARSQNKHYRPSHSLPH
jgi:hypothetical protein